MKFPTPSQIAVRAIRLYQRYLSPDHSLWARASDRPPYCKYVPSCSEYGAQAFQKRGFFIGFAKTFWRILRCNPWSRGGYDPVDPEVPSVLPNPLTSNRSADRVRPSDP